MPTLVLWGAQDALVPVAVGQTLEEAPPLAQLEVLQGCGLSTMLEKPGESAAIFTKIAEESLSTRDLTRTRGVSE